MRDADGRAFNREKVLLVLITLQRGSMLSPKKPQFTYDKRHFMVKLLFSSAFVFSAVLCAGFLWQVKRRNGFLRKRFV
jgi:predicted membrane protein